MINTYHSFEDWGQPTHVDIDSPELLEAYKGTLVVDWAGRIEQQLIDKISYYEKGKNQEYSAKLRAMLNTWRDNRIDGAVNRENIEICLAAADQLGVDSWKLQPYFQNLATQLRKLIASVEELPVAPPPEPKAPKGSKAAAATMGPKPTMGPEKTEGGPEAAAKAGEPVEAGIK